MQRLISFVVLASVLIGMGAGGCARQARMTVPIAGIPPQPEYPTLLEVDNFNGSVRIVVDANREPRIWAAVRRDNRKAPRRGRDELAGLVEVEATSEMNDGARLLRVTSRPTTEVEDVAVDLTIRIARSAGTAVRNSGGLVELVGVGGSVVVENGIAGRRGGNIQVRTAQAMVAPVHLVSTTGSVLYQVGPGSRGHFDLQSDEGRAEFSTRLGRVDGVSSGPTWWRGTLDHGQNEVKLRGNGIVRVAVMENAQNYSPNMARGQTTSDLMSRLRGE